MTDYKARIRKIVGSAPADLVAYYEKGDFPRFPAGSINCLSFEDAEQYTRNLTDPALVRLGLWVLDDANDSNPYCYITQGPCSGAIIWLTHDREPAIVFTSLNEYLTEIRRIIEIDGNIDDLERDGYISFPLNRDIFILCQEGNEDANFLIGLYLPVCSNLGEDVKKSLVVHKSLFVREALAVYLKKHPAVDDLVYAEQLASDQADQVARPGKEAKSAINKLKWKR